jgi:hypothetical protein
MTANEISEWLSLHHERIGGAFLNVRSPAELVKDRATHSEKMSGGSPGVFQRTTDLIGGHRDESEPFPVAPTGWAQDGFR